MGGDPLVAELDALLRRDENQLLVVSPSRAATAGDVGRLAVAVAGTLDRRLVGPGRLVGLAAANGPAFLAGLVALLRLGCTVLLFDWRTPQAEKQRIASSLGASGVLHCATGWPESTGDLVLEPAPPGESGRADLPDLPAGLGGVALLTSGSTGTPQAILRRSEALLADDDALAVSMGLREDEQILAAIPLSHAYGLSSVALPALRRGSVLMVPDEGDPLATMRAVAESAVTFMPTVPAYLQAVLRLSSPPPLPPSLRLVITAGAPIRPETAARFRNTYGLPVHVFYGASEVGGICYDREGGAAERGTLGTPVEGVTVTLEPAEGVGQSDLSQDQGVVTIRSRAVAVGYYPEPDQRLGGGCFRSSDLGTFRRNGELELLGRIDDLIIVRGKKVSPGEVEEVISRLDGVDETVVLAVGEAAGEGQVVRAVVVCRSGQVGYDQVLAWCRSSLVAHKVPRSIILVDEIPRTDRGKVDRAALRALRPPENGNG